MFSILIPTWDNLEFLKLLYNSITKNSYYTHELIFFVQEEPKNEETVKWLTDNKLTYIGDKNNIGISKAVNQCFYKATKEWICHIDDDMYLCPNWDYELLSFIESNKLGKNSWVSSVMIEPSKKRWNARIYQDFGRTVKTFDEEALLNSYHSFTTMSIRDNQSNPLLIHSEMWKKIGGADEDFFAIGFEEGLAKKMWDAGCRVFVTAPNSKTYHFQNQSTKKIINRAESASIRDNLFMSKHGIAINTFLDSYLLRGTPF